MCDSLYCEICFIEVVCSQTHNISKVCLYTHYNFPVHPISASPQGSGHSHIVIFLLLAFPASPIPHILYIISVHFSHSVMSDSSQPHGLQHARLPYPSPSPRACSNSCPSSRRCHPTISSSVIPFSPCLQSFPASGSFPMSQLFTLEGQSIGTSYQVFFLNLI